MVDYFITCHSFDRAKVEVLVLLYVFFYPPFASIAKGEVFGLLHVCLFVRQRFLDNPRADSGQSSHAGVLWFRMCLLPFWGLAAPRRAEKEANEIFVTMGVNGEFLHFGGF